MSIILAVRKKAFFLVALFAIVSVGMFAGCEIGSRRTDYEQVIIRLHIRAHSDSVDDQNIKLVVRDNIVDFLEPRLAVVGDREGAYRILEQLLGDIQIRTNAVLRSGGFAYSSAARLNNEFFPTRSYEGIVVPSGYYDALIIELGNGTGQNWWCVIYPPLCFVGRQNGSNSFEYRSIIRDLWDRWFG